MTYSSDLRQKVLEKLEQGYSIRQTAKLFGIHFTTVRNWKKQPLPTTPKPPQVRPPKKISKEALLADVEAYPTDYLYERAARFGCIQNMLDKGELAFVLPHQLDNSTIDKVNIYNAFRFQSIKDYTYEIKHEYQDIDYLVSEYYLTCLDENLITYRNFFKLLEEMILRYPSISFSSFFSDRTLFFNVWKSNFYLHYFRCVSQKYRHNELAIYNMSYYLCDIYENNRKWKNGKFNLDFLNQQNREFIEELSDGV